MRLKDKLDKSLVSSTKLYDLDYQVEGRRIEQSISAAEIKMLIRMIFVSRKDKKN